MPEGVEILDQQILKVSDDSSTISIFDNIKEEGGSYSNFEFDYLDKKESFVLQLVHNGTSEEKIEIKGKIKGVKEVRRISSAELPSPMNNVLMALDPVTLIPVHKLVQNSAFMKYFGSLTYLGFGVLCTWVFFDGENNWGLLGASLLCYLASLLMYHKFRYIAPVKV